jgi:hypothetical protein
MPLAVDVAVAKKLLQQCDILVSPSKSVLRHRGVGRAGAGRRSQHACERRGRRWSMNWPRSNGNTTASGVRALALLDPFLEQGHHLIGERSPLLHVAFGRRKWMVAPLVNAAVVRRKPISSNRPKAPRRAKGTPQNNDAPGRRACGDRSRTRRMPKARQYPSPIMPSGVSTFARSSLSPSSSGVLLRDVPAGIVGHQHGSDDADDGAESDVACNRISRPCPREQCRGD